ncbi:MAG: carbohydrate ABC transporter permease [Chloroflexi bacterium]|nr:carbohydrate ABC transporter permease [Chloroflexota bacterium]MCL5110333.1 carbohydrate ABC transporter permease [Chloroflexota bacterium]MDA8219421.1 carbohydrate ABC transporter permease [Dehalococcoidales bacterium]
MGYRQRRRLVAWLCAIIVAAALAFTFFPFFWLITTSLKKPIDAFALPPTWIFIPTLDNYGQVLEAGFLKSYFNNTLVGILCTMVSLILGVPAAYAMVRANFRGKSFMGAWILLSRLAPPVAFAIPLYVLFRSVGLVDNYLGLTIAYLTITMPFVVWIMTGFFEGVPVELEEAALIDGCTRLGALLRVVLPVSTPGLATAAIFSLMMSWNQYFYPLILGGRNTITSPVMITGFVTFEGPNWGKLAAAGVLVVAPVLVFTVVAQRGIVRGLVGGAVK